MNELTRCKCGSKAAMRFLPEMGVFMIGCESCKDCLGADTSQRAVELWNEKQQRPAADKPEAAPLSEAVNGAAEAFRKFGEAIRGNEEPEKPAESEEKPDELEARGIAAVIMVLTGILFLVGAVGSADFSGVIDNWYFPRIAFGFALIAAGVFVGVREGRRKGGKNHDRK